MAPDRLPALDPFNVWKLSSSDLIVTPRPRSALIEALFLMRAPHRRPAIVVVSDGYIFRQNVLKAVNRRYGWLNRHVLADRMLVAQPLESLEGICDEMAAVDSVVSYEVTGTSSRVAQPVFVLVAGNDPFFDLPRADCIAAFTGAYAALRARFGADTRICLSASNAALAEPVLAASPGLEAIGRVSDADIDPACCLFAGSPSTVLHDQFLVGRPTYVLPLYAESGVGRFCAPLPELLAAEMQDGIVTATHKAPRNLHRRHPIEPPCLAHSVKARRVPTFGPRRYLAELQPLVLVNELRLLFWGYMENRR